MYLPTPGSFPPGKEPYLPTPFAKLFVPPKGTKLSWRRTQPYAVVSTAIVNIFFGGVPYGATNRMRGVPKCGGVHNAKEYDRSDYERMNAGGLERE